MGGRAITLSKRATGEAIDHNSQEDLDQTQFEKGLAAAGVSELTQVFNRPDSPARWTGSAAAAHGLVGNADRDMLTAVLQDGVLNGAKIRRKSVKVATFGAILTAPKTVSALLAHPDPRVRDAAKAAWDAAGGAYINTLETMVRTRTGTDGVTSVAIGGLVVAEFTHFSSSTGDPHLHKHYLINATTPGPDGKWRTLDSRTFFAAKRQAEAAAMVAMQDSLNQSLGIDSTAWEVKQVGSVQTPELAALAHLIEPLSNARRHVEDQLADMGKFLGAQTWREDLTAWRKHRVQRGTISEKIEFAVDAALGQGGEAADKVREMWNARTEGQLTQALQNVQWGFALKPEPKLTAAQIEAKALAWVDEQHTWSHADVAAFLTYELRDDRAAALTAARMIDDWAEHGLVHTSGELTPAVEAVLNREECSQALVHSRIGLKAQFVSEAALRAEVQLRDQAKDLAEQRGVRLAVEVKDWMSPEQVQAIQLLAQGRKLTVMTGVGGSGKTTIMEPVAEAAHNRGMPVFSIARNAARALDTGNGINADYSMSVAAFLSRDIEKLGKNRPILLAVDEAAVIDRAELAAILAKAEAKGSKVQVVLFGDRDQAPSIDRKGGFALVQEGAANAGAHLHLKKSYRCQLWEEEALELRHGAAEPIVERAEREARLLRANETNYAEQAAERIAASESMTALVLSNSEAATISKAVQARLCIEATHAIAQDNYCGVGDRVRTRANDWGNKVLNGDRWTVAELHNDNSITVADKAGKTVKLSREYTRSAVELDYASTLDSAQEITVQKALPVVRDGMGRRQLYSAATRGREAPEFLVVSDSDDHSRILRNVVQTDDLAKTAHEIRVEIETERRVEQETAQRQQNPPTWEEFFEAAGPVQVQSKAAVHLDSAEHGLAAWEAQEAAQEAAQLRQRQTEQEQVNQQAQREQAERADKLLQQLQSGRRQSRSMGGPSLG